jgi:putative transcriptional regulator
VAPTGILGLLRSGNPPAESRRVLDDLHVISTRAPLESVIRSGPGPNRLRLYVGYSGWGAGQLERETVQGAWHLLSSDTNIVFDPDPTTLWERQIRRTESRMARHRSSAPSKALAAPG